MALGQTGLQSCVDHDYDLSEDIDMTVEVGGDLSIPASGMDVMTLDQILDLDNGSSIQTLANGNYVLNQEGSSKPANFKVDKVEIHGQGNTVYTPLALFTGGLSDEIVQPADMSMNILNLDKNDVTTELVRIDKGTIRSDMEFKIGYESSDFSGSLIIKKGYTALFNENWTVEIVDPASAQFLEIVNHYTVKFKRDVVITKSAPMDALVRLSKVEFPVGGDEGLIAPGIFHMESYVKTWGDVAISSTELGHGQTANIMLVTTTGIYGNGEILDVTGIVNPDINIEPTDFSISGIPDFLKESENVLDIENPRIVFNVMNNSPLTLEVKGRLNSYKNGNSAPLASVAIGFGNKITVPANATTDFVICRHGDASDPWFAGKTVIEVPDLSDIIKTIPDRLEFVDVDCKAVQEPVTFRLGENYSYNAEYDAYIPLAFGPEMRLHYTHEETDWDEDLSDYNFKELHITADVTNTLPLSLTPQVLALGKNGRELSNITVDITDNAGAALKIMAGSTEAPATTSLKIVLKSTGTNIADLDGVRLVFDGYDPMVGVSLNSGQSLRFDNISVRIQGGVIIDLN